jgi:hypothetical protein
MYKIIHIAYEQIDKEKWDQCIEQAPNGLIYAYSWYLDACGVKWDGLVLNNYEAVMPLTWNKKFGIYYLFQPWFCASLGVFGKHIITEDIIQNFIKAIPKKFRYIDICLNYGNQCRKEITEYTQRISYILSLNTIYEEIRKEYRTQLKRNIAKAKSAGLITKWGIDIKEIYPLAKEIMQRVSPINDEEVKKIIPLFKEVITHKQAETIGIYSKNGELLSSAAFFYSHQRWYYLIVGNHPNGKTLGASHLLIDRFIEKHAHTSSILDFEGSDIRNIAFFYSSFGAVTETYQSIKINRLPRIIRWLKK